MIVISELFRWRISTTAYFTLSVALCGSQYSIAPVILVHEAETITVILAISTWFVKPTA